MKQTSILTETGVIINRTDYIYIYIACLNVNASGGNSLFGEPNSKRITEPGEVQVLNVYCKSQFVSALLKHSH